MKKEFIELYRCIVPADKIINDNHGQHYRIHQSNLEWLTAQFNEILSGQKDVVTGYGRGAKHTFEPAFGPCNFIVPDKQIVEDFVNKNKTFQLRCEVWRPREIRFDPQNYAKTFKAPIDLLVFNKYLPDDSWKCVSGITYCGGGSSVWNKRAWRYENDKLPDELTCEWWLTEANDYGDILIRILILQTEE